MAIIEGYWDCPYCGKKGIRGRESACPSCGKTRAAETKFYMRETTPVADEASVDKGPDWFCPYCDSYNKASDTVCKNCGHPRDAEDKDYFAVRREQEQKESARREAQERVTQPEQRRPAHRGSSRRWIAIALILALIVAGVYLFSPKSRAVTVADKTWQRSVEVQEDRLVEEDGWTLPPDAVELLDTRREIHHYDQILDHYETVTEERSRQVQDGYDTYTTYEDMGNGYFEEIEHSEPRYVTEYYTVTYEEPVYRSVPVYEMKYYYTVWRWVYDRTETAAGQTDPYWPDVQYAENEREGPRSEEYTVTCVTKNDRQDTYRCGFDVWSALDIGKSYDIRVQSGEILEVLP